MRVWIGRPQALVAGGIALVMLGFVAGRSSLGLALPVARPAPAPTSVDPMRWLPLEWNGARKPVAYKHMYFSRDRRR